MVISVYPSSIGLKQKDKLSGVRELLSFDKQDEAHQKFSAALQASLNLNEILELFIDHARGIVPISGLSYRNTAQNAPLLLGKEGRHRCDYCLMTSKSNLGNITFSRDKRFSELELAIIELLLSVLIYPLQKVLKNQSVS